MSLERKSRALAVRRRRFAVLWVALVLLVALSAGIAAMFLSCVEGHVLLHACLPQGSVRNYVVAPS
jgi:hypothetical protein